MPVAAGDRYDLIVIMAGTIGIIFVYVTAFSFKIK